MKREKQERERKLEERFQGFLRELENRGLVEKVTQICIGRALVGLDGNAKLAEFFALFQGIEPHEIAARLDLFFWLDFRGYSRGDIFNVFRGEWGPKTIARGIELRTGRRGTIGV